MNAGLVVIHFGEPPAPEPEPVRNYLTRIFLQNADLEDADSPEAARERAEELAERRMPGLLEEYEEIGGSPLNAQAEAQADALAEHLSEWGYDIEVAIAYQFFEPSIEDVLARFADANVETLVVLPVYPLCGPSTTVAALEIVDDVVAEMTWDPRMTQLSGWHRHPTYLQLRAENIRAFALDRGVDPRDAETTLLFSAHGTPMRWVEDGSRYVAYVEETCEAIASLLGVSEYALGYQNHENRDIPWTEPAVEEVLAGLSSERVLVEPVSFMHEQSETLAELDRDLAEDAESLGIDFHRVPIPHDDPRFPRLLAELVQPALAALDPAMFQLRQCRCKPTAGTWCLNAPAR